MISEAGARVDLTLFRARGNDLALVSREGSVTYAELGARARAVAEKLGALGIGEGEPVGLLSAGRAHDEPTALAGLLAHGAVVVPLDATAPPTRLAAILRARGARALVLDSAAASLADAVDEQRAMPIGRVTLSAQGDVVGTAPAPRTPPTDAPDLSIACILHTSGSTGTPKPVPIGWEGLDAFTAWAVDLLGLSPGDRVLRVAELIFDLAWFDHLATWRAGATLCTMARRDLASGRALRDAMAQLGPTVVYGVPSMFMKLVAALPQGAPLDPAPRAVMFAGEIFPPRELLAFAERCPGARLFNFYGPTETNVCTFHEVDRTQLDGVRETPIGRACPYAVCTLVATEEESAQVIEGPGTGELLVEGPTVAGGGPFATRDRVMRGEDGLFYFRGRIDRMVKIRGYRVEPGEVEAALETHPAVRQAAVTAHEDPRLGKVLRAFVALRPDGGPVDERALRVYLGERLPPYMVPERVSLLDDLPRTTTGKIDYRALV